MLLSNFILEKVLKDLKYTCMKVSSKVSANTKYYNQHIMNFNINYPNQHQLLVIS